MFEPFGELIFSERVCCRHFWELSLTMVKCVTVTHRVRWCVYPCHAFTSSLCLPYIPCIVAFDTTPTI